MCGISSFGPFRNKYVFLSSTYKQHTSYEMKKFTASSFLAPSVCASPSSSPLPCLSLSSLPPPPSHSLIITFFITRPSLPLPNCSPTHRLCPIPTPQSALSETDSAAGSNHSAHLPSLPPLPLPSLPALTSNLTTAERATTE